jgi:hypothetical protein
MTKLSVHIISCFSEILKINNGFFENELLYGLVLAVIVEIIIINSIMHTIQ